MRILGIGGDGHDVSFAVLEDGIPEVLVEKERLTRIKMDRGNAEHSAFENCRELPDIDCVVKAKGESADWHLIEVRLKYEVWHHTAHAAHAFFSSPFERAIIFTMDGGGKEGFGICGGMDRTAFTVWQGMDNKISMLHKFPFRGSEGVNLGGIWSRVTKEVLGLSIGMPLGNQSGTVMAMAAFGDPARFRDYFQLSRPTRDLEDLKKYVGEGQAKFDIAAALQEHTEKVLLAIMKQYPAENICLSGGVALNSVAIGKMLKWFPKSKIYVCPVPYDGGLSIGAAQYVWHNELDGPRIVWQDNVSPYLGYEYSKQDVLDALQRAQS